MSSLADKLRALGVQTGIQNVAPPKPRRTYNLETVLSGRYHTTPLGDTYVVEDRYLPEYRQGRMCLQITAPLEEIANWTGERSVSMLPQQSFAFIDTETTGLSGGTGTYAFLIGVGRFEGEEFHLAQFFMRDPLEEPAQLAAVEEFIAPCDALVTFNGKAFDIPLLNTRYITHGWQPPPFRNAPHVDLLHLARRLWRNRLASRTLGNLEYQILGAARTEEDVPGWQIPSLYFQYLNDGDATPLKRVFYHNAMDVVSMAALFNHMAGLLSDPFSIRPEDAVDLISLARHFEDLGEIEKAVRLYLHGLEHQLPADILLDAVQRLSLIYKRNEEWPSAVELWRQAARYNHLPAFVELAKFYEHQARLPEEAAQWTQRAIDIVSSPDVPLLDRRRWLPELEHRLSRLQRKMGIEPER